MDWQTYEETVKNIYSTLGKDNGIEILGHGNSCKVMGKSGVEHQIDVLTQNSDGLHSYKTAIECKYWNEKINKDILMKVDSVVRDCNFNKGVIVSKIGFTPDAIKYAEYIGLGLIELREFKDEDWEGLIRNIVINLTILSPDITIKEVKIDTNKYSSEQIEEIRKNPYLIEHSDNILILEPNKPEKNLTELMDEFYSTLKIEDGYIDKEYNFISGSLLRLPNGNELYIRQIILSGQLTEQQNTININADDIVWLKMKAIFEKKEYTIYKDGNIKDVSKT